MLLRLLLLGMLYLSGAVGAKFISCISDGDCKEPALPHCVIKGASSSGICCSATCQARCHSCLPGSGVFPTHGRELKCLPILRGDPFSECGPSETCIAGVCTPHEAVPHTNATSLDDIFYERPQTDPGKPADELLALPWQLSCIRVIDARLLGVLPGTPVPADTSDLGFAMRTLSMPFSRVMVHEDGVSLVYSHVNFPPENSTADAVLRPAAGVVVIEFIMPVSVLAISLEGERHHTADITITTPSGRSTTRALSGRLEAEVVGVRLHRVASIEVASSGPVRIRGIAYATLHRKGDDCLGGHVVAKPPPPRNDLYFYLGCLCIAMAMFICIERCARRYFLGANGFRRPHASPHYFNNPHAHDMVPASIVSSNIRSRRPLSAFRSHH